MNVRCNQGVDSVASHYGFLLNRGADQFEPKLAPCWHNQNGDCGERPQSWRSWQHEPPQYEQQEGGRLDQASPQIIENFPLGGNRDRIADSLPRLIRNFRQQPLRSLPIAAQPAMFTTIVGAVVRRVILNHFDVARQTRSRVSTFNEIMT